MPKFFIRLAKLIGKNNGYRWQAWWEEGKTLKTNAYVLYNESTHLPPEQ